MHFDINYGGAPAEFPWGWIFLWTLFWVGTLARILTRRDFDTLNKLLWIVVVIFVPFFGAILYFALAPADKSAPVERKKAPIRPKSDLAGTPWETNPGHTYE